jgi:hypothetical protein
MKYSKPELLVAEAALEAIQGIKGGQNDDQEGGVEPTVAAYEVDE